MFADMSDAIPAPDAEDPLSNKKELEEEKVGAAGTKLRTRATKRKKLRSHDSEERDGGSGIKSVGGERLDRNIDVVLEPRIGSAAGSIGQPLTLSQGAVQFAVSEGLLPSSGPPFM